MSELLNKFNQTQDQVELMRKMRADKRTVKVEERNTLIDDNTGTVLKDELSIKTVGGKGKEPAFVKLYLDDLILLKNLPTSSSEVLWELIKCMSNFENQIILNSAIKKRICEKLDIKLQTLNNSITKFVKKEILYRLDKGIYMPNPYLLWQGNWEEVKQFRMIVDYTSEAGKIIKTEINGVEAGLEVAPDIAK